MSYDPKAHGAKCDVCPLNHKTPCPPDVGKSISIAEHLGGGTVALVGDMPSDQDERQRKVFCGPAGLELNKALRKASISRASCLTTNVLLCRPPKGRIREYITKINKQNREMEKQYKEDCKLADKEERERPKPPTYIQNPVECCAPRLEEELSEFSRIITMGGLAYKQVTRSKSAVSAVRGSIMSLEGTIKTLPRQIVPTVHPSFVMQNARWFNAFFHDFKKAGQWFRGEVSWEPPDIIFQPSLDNLRSFLFQKAEDGSIPIFAYDLETDGIEPLSARIRCLAIGFRNKVVVISILSKDGHTRFFNYQEEKAYIALLKEFFEDQKIPKYGWNSITYDSAVLRAQWAIEVNNHIDGILLHKSVESELPHSLSHAVAMYEVAPPWKTNREGEKLSTSSETDRELAVYCGYDTALTAGVLDPLIAGVATRGQFDVYVSDHKIQHVCRAMHQVGMYVDQAKRLETEKQLLARRFNLLKELRDIAGNDKFNPGSIYQVRDILFDRWNLEVPLDDKERLTSSDDPSTSDIVLRALLTDRRVQDKERHFIKCLRYFRKIMKVLGTYVLKLRPWTMAIEQDLGWDEDDDWVDKETRERYGLEKRGIVNPYTNRMYPGWSGAMPVCVHPETWILSREGLIQIGDLQGFGAPGEEVPAKNLELHDGSSWADVSHLQNPGVCPVLRLKTTLGFELIGTPHHRIHVAVDRKGAKTKAYGAFLSLTKRDKSGRREKIPRHPDWDWCRLDEAEKGYYVKIPMGMDIWGSNTCVPRVSRLQPQTNANEVWLPTQLDEDLAFFVGFYNADGSLHDSNGSFQIRISDTKGSVRGNNVLDVCLRLFGPNATKRNSAGISITSISLRDWCAALELGRGIEKKKMPSWLRSAPKNFVLAYLRGLFFDSHIKENGKKGYCWTYTGTKELAQEVQMLLLNIGIPSALADMREENSPRTWGCRVCAQDVSRVALLAGIPFREQKEERSNRNFTIRGNHLWVKVVSVEDAGLQQVYDVTIPSTHQFWSNGFVSHNTGRLSSFKPINCFDGQTEILTKQGWVRFDALPKGLAVAQWSDETREISFVLPTAYHQGRHQGYMVSYRSQSSDLLMTPNHRIPVLKQASKRIVTLTADELHDLGHGNATFHSGFLKRKEQALPLTKAELQLMVAIHADGFLVPLKSGFGVDIAFQKQRKVERFRNILAALPEGYDFKLERVGTGRYDTRYRWYLRGTDRLNKLLSWIQGEARLWGSWLLDGLSEEQASVFEEELWHWDADFGKRTQYANKCEENADWIQAFLCTRGIRANKAFYTNNQGNSVWLVTVRRTEINAITHRSERERIPFDDQVYCVTVPADAIVVRRAGKVTITRQSMNFPKAIRGIVTCQPGNVLVGADADQLEIRVAAALWQIQKYLLAFQEGKDPHSMTAFLVFGLAFCEAAGIDPKYFSIPGKLVGDAYDDKGMFIGKGKPKSLRDLSKAVHFASICKGEKVALIGRNAETPIEEVKQGDWTWAWSKKRERYEPTQVKHVWQHGEQDCIKVTLGWGTGNKHTCSVVLTPDHPFIMRDGTLRHAGSLSVGDRVMPFRRRMVSSNRPIGQAYYHLNPFNDERIVSEHRIVKGFYESGQRNVHVHHKDGNGRNNHPDNLEIKDYLDHYKEHEEAITQGRLNSEKWRAAVANPKVNQDPVKKAAAAAKQAETLRGRILPSVLDAWADRIGKELDVIIAKEAGCTPEAVAYYRKVRSIPPPMGQRGWLVWLLSENDDWRRLLCTFSSEQVAEAVNSEFGTAFTRASINGIRKRLGIPAPKRVHKTGPGPSKLDAWADRIGKELDVIIAKEAGCTPEAVTHYRKVRGIARAKRQGTRNSSVLDTWVDRIGHESDAIIAKEAGVTRQSVVYYRKTRGIPAYWKEKEAVNPTNHTVLAVEYVGMREVWDIEVDHEDHNFALSCGIFVHNSQYMATVDRVHKMIQSAETDNPDGTTDLPYAQLPLSRVREMHSKWMKGAPEYERGWEREINEWRAQGFLLEPVGGRRRDFLDSKGGEESANELVNFKVQCVPGHVRVLTTEGYIQIRELAGKPFVAWTGKKWARATAFSKGLAKLVSVNTNHALSLVCDETHKLKVPMRSAYEWREARDLGSKTRVALDLARPLEFGQEIGTENAYMLGFDFTEGSAIPEVIWRSSLADRKEFLRGLQEGNGYQNPSKTGLADLELLFRTVGIGGFISGDLYDHAAVTSVSDLKVEAEVFTLSVDDPEHCYVANGFVSKNSGAAAWMNKALIEIYEQIPENCWGPGTGIINQCHDHIVVECPENQAEKVAKIIERAMNGTHPGLPGVYLSASAEIGKAWSKV